jgi:poly(hydroxyalkanoate) granule-associated protein
MTDTTINTTYTFDTETIRENARKLWLTGFGFFGLVQDQFNTVQDRLGNVQDEMQKFFGELVERGEVVESDSREMINDLVSTYRRQAKEATSKVESEWDKQLEGVVARMNIPTSDDISKLTKKIDTLNRKVEALKKQQMPAA